MLKKEVISALTEIVGEDNILTSKCDLECYTYNAGGGVPSTCLPMACMLPNSVEQVSRILTYCNEHSIAVVTRCMASGLSVNAIPESENSIILSTQKFKHLSVDPETLTATVGAGVITSDIKDAASKHGLFYPPDPASFTFSSIGGNVATDAGGLQCVKYGTTKSYITGMQVVLPSGEVIRCGGKCIKNVTGYNLIQLFTGSEGTLGVITEVILKLIPMPEGKKAMLVAFDDMDNAAKAVSGIMISGVTPSIMEFMENTFIVAVQAHTGADLPTEAAAMLLVEVDGDISTLDHQVNRIIKVCKDLGMISYRIANTEEEAEILWQSRRAALPALARVAKGRLGGDPAAPINTLAIVVKLLRDLGKKYNIKVSCQGHAGDGNVHPHFFFDNDEEKVRAGQARDEFHQGIIDLGGTVSAEHGVGREKVKYMKKQLGEAQLNVMIQIKKSIDPKNIMNPGCMFGDLV